VTSSCRRQYYFFSTPEIPPSASEKIRTSAFLTSESLSSRSSDSSRAGSRSIVASPPEAAPSRAENGSRHRYERITPARLSRISVWRTASCSFAWPRSASTEDHRVENLSLSASDWSSSSVLKSTRQIRKSGSDGRIIEIATSPIAEYLTQDLLIRVNGVVVKQDRYDFLRANLAGFGVSGEDLVTAVGSVNEPLKVAIRSRAPGSGLRAPGSGLRAPGSGLRAPQEWKRPP
jgi:hypothetical protein